MGYWWGQDETLGRLQNFAKRKFTKNDDKNLVHFQSVLKRRLTENASRSNFFYSEKNLSLNMQNDKNSAIICNLFSTT